MPQPSQVSPLLPIVDVSRRLNCRVSHVYRLVESGALPAFRIGPRALRVDEHEPAMQYEPTPAEKQWREDQQENRRVLLEALAKRQHAREQSVTAARYQQPANRMDRHTLRMA